MEGAWTEALCRVPWEVFGTLTFSGHVPSEAMQKRRLMAWLRGVASVEGKYDAGHLVWFVRPEAGELFGRDHFHILLAFLGCRTKAKFHGPMPFFVARAREQGFGLTKFRNVVAGDGSLGYLSYTSAADNYEMAKTARTREPMLSRRLEQILKFNLRRNRCEALKGSLRFMGQTGEGTTVQNLSGSRGVVEN